MRIKNASEPTDIIWENRHFSVYERYVRTFIVIMISFLLLLISFAVIYEVTEISVSIYF